MAPPSPPRHRLIHQSLRSPPLLPSLLLSLSLTLGLLVHLTSHTPFSNVPSLRTLPEEHPHNLCPRSPPTPPIYIFLHLHKTAGNNLKTALFSFASRNHLSLHHTCHRTAGDSTFQAFWFNRDKPSNAIDCNLDALATLPADRRAKLDLVMGHQFVGAHSLFPARDVRYFTFVRHPLVRKTSHFLHFEGEPSIKRLGTYLMERNRNYMTKRLATDVFPSEVGADLRGRFVDVDNFATRAALRAAKRNLQKRFFFVGLVERYHESMCVLDKLLRLACGREGNLAKVGFRVEKLVATHENSRGGTNEWVDRLSKRVKNAALRAESADVELYRFAEMLFEQKLRQYPECSEK